MNQKGANHPKDVGLSHFERFMAVTHGRAVFHNETFDGHFGVWFLLHSLEIPHKSTTETHKRIQNEAHNVKVENRTIIGSA